jgi:NAD(P)H-dependent flavin oxidoreductase YrpB (nitropropane dioxygenase family)
MLRTKLTTALGIKHPVILAGMDEAAGPELVAAVSNAGGMGVVGGALYTPKQLKELLDGVKVQEPVWMRENRAHQRQARLHRPNLPFGVNLLVAQIGGNARKTNVRMMTRLEASR